ncbi:hypothetical protein RHMOL_Rhmol11G0146600 [Rhododendron molle]|uniref:Uncharacterized protein n=1 Tax=Rhododendron molle TaxID=49168 RepID=A0ACC0LS87_RHOML|nr:hypothetical protein RHMOL_Rhmol11G0146600 [Rhododendron molle]
MTNQSLPMAFAKVISLASLLLAISTLLLASLLAVSDAHYNSYVPSSEHIVKGLSLNFYEYECPDVEYIVRKHLKKVFKEDIGQAAGLLRIQFHDCFVLVNTNLLIVNRGAYLVLY